MGGVIVLDKGGDGMKGMKMSIRWQAVLLGLGVGMLTVVCGCAAGSALMIRGAVDLSSMGLWAAVGVRRCCCEWGRGPGTGNAAAGENRESAQIML